MTPEIEQGNKVINIFMGLKLSKLEALVKYPKGYGDWEITYWTPTGIKTEKKYTSDKGCYEWLNQYTSKYHSSWDWFHGVFDKFKSMQLKQWEGEGVSWNHKYSFHLSRIGNAMVHSTLLDAFGKLTEAIEWHTNYINKVK